MPQYLLPDVGEGLTEAEIVSWKVKVGDTIAINDIVCEIETAKSIVELPSPYAGVISAILAPEGETIPVGTPIIAIGDDAAPSGDAPAEPEMEIDLSNPAASGSGEGESLVGRMKADRGPTRRARKVSSGAAAAHMQAQAAFEAGASPMVEAEEPEPAVPARSQQPAEPLEPAAVRVLAKPPVRKLAKDLGVDLATITPTGPNGTVTRGDVETAYPGVYVEETSSGVHRIPGVPTSTGERETREPIKGVRKMMAGAMVQSAFSAPARHRVGDRRRDPHRRVRRAAQGAPRVPRREGLAAAGAGPGRDAGDASYAGDQLVLGRGGPGGRVQAATSTSASPPPPRAAWWSRTSRTPRTSRCSTWPPRSAS